MKVKRYPSFGNSSGRSQKVDQEDPLVRICSSVEDGSMVKGQL